MKNINTILGSTIKKAREDKKLSQEILSSFANITRPHLSAIERGERLPSFRTFVKLSYALKTKPSELIKPFEDEFLNNRQLIDEFWDNEKKSK